MICYFFILYLFQICAYKIMENEISLYPTVGEYYEYDLYQIMYQNAYLVYEKGEQYYEQQNMNKRFYLNYEQKWIQSPKIGNVDIMNQFQEMNTLIGNQYKSLSSNNTHFGTLSMENEVIIYKWNNQILQQIGSSVYIDTSQICFNIHLFAFDILVDCYQDEQFNLFNISNNPYKIVNSSSSMPIKTKFQQMVNDNGTYIIYAQFYQDYSMLSLFSAQFSNLTQWNNNFVDFDIPIRINPYIYILTQQQILQCTISTNYTFQLQYSFTQDNISNFIAINLYNNIQTYSQCDQILVQYQSDSGEDFLISSLWGCTNQIMITNIDNQFKFNEPIQTILQNNQYIIFQQNHTLHLYQIGKPVVFQYDNKIETNSLLYFNSDNELFSFHEMIIAYKIQIPSLSINLTNLQVVGNSSKFSLMCFNQKRPQNQNILKINLIILPKNDKNVYSFAQHQYAIMNNNINMNFFSYSGSFLTFSPNYDTDYFQFSQTTFTPIGSQSSYYLVQQLSIMQNFSGTLFFIGYNKSYISIFKCSNYPQQSKLKYTLLNTIKISLNAALLQAAYSIYPEILIIGLSDSQTIYLYQQQYEVNGTYSYQNQTFEQEIINFLVTQNNIIILFKNNEISIMTLDFENILTLNQEQINQHFQNKTIQFDPRQIIMNTQLQSSFLFINNVQDVIIFSIQQNSKPIPIQLIQVNFAIKQINLVNQQLILSYICNNNSSICFQVWNVQNLPKYYYEKNLCEVENGNNITIQSDNLFFYVTFTNLTVYIYNPSLPYHMSLYYQQVLQSINSIAIQNQNSLLFNQSIIFEYTTFYSLAQTQGMMISNIQSNQDFNFTYPQSIYNYNVSSALNQQAIQRTPNQSITYLSNFAVFQDKSITIDLTLDDQDNRNNHFSYPLNLFVDRQFSNCSIQYNIDNLNFIDIFKIQQLLARSCLITYYPNTYDESIKNTSSYQRSFITSINNQFISYLHNRQLIILNNNLTESNYTWINFTQCLASTSDNFTQYLICQNQTQQYLVNFTVTSSGQIVNLTQIQLPQSFSNIFKMRSSLSQIFILGELGNQDQYLYWFNQSNNSFIQLTQEFSILNDNYYNCQDFSIDQFQYHSYEQKNMIIIFQTIRNQLFYRIMEIQSENVTINPLIYVIIHYCNFQYSCVELNEFNYVLIIKIMEGNLIVLVTDKHSFSYLVSIIINPFRIQQYNDLATVIRTIPNLNQYYYTGNSVYFGGILIQQFKYGQNYTMGVYYLDDYEGKSIQEPILMQDSFYSPKSNTYAMIVNQTYPCGIALSLGQNYVQIYPFSTSNITCNMKKNQLYRNVQLDCENFRNYGTYNITFNLQSKKRNNKGQIYALLSLIILMLIYFFYKITSKVRSSKLLNLEIEL